jgi:thiamine-monophosphate kinase
MSQDNNLDSLGEFGLIGRLQEIARQSASSLLGNEPVVDSGDDAAIIAFGTAHVAMSVDVFVEETHFRKDWSSGIDIGRRCAAAAMADICAMGTLPTTLLVGIAAPGATSINLIREIFTGLTDEAAVAGARVVGGDISSASQIFISVTALGLCPKKGVTTRSGAKVGDVVALSGSTGRAAAGLRVLQRGLRSPRTLVEAYRSPTIDYTAGVRAREAGARSMIDISDGLVADLRHIAVASRVDIDVDSATLELTEDLISAAAAFGIDPLLWALTGGDDHALAAVFPSAEKVPDSFRVIGKIVEVGNESQPLVTVDGGSAPDIGGYSHFE